MGHGQESEENLCECGIGQQHLLSLSAKVGHIPTDVV